MKMISFHITLLSLTTMTFICGLNGSSCDEDCADKPVFSPPSLVVQYGHSASVRCTACQQGCQHERTGMDVSVGRPKKDGNMMLWKVDELLEWDLSGTCYHTNDNGTRCCSHLPVTVYRPPSFVFFELIDLFDDNFENIQYMLECTVVAVRPIENVVVTFYKEVNRSVETIGQLKSRQSSRTPETKTFTLNVANLKDDGSLYRCEAKFDFGPEGPQPPLVYTSMAKDIHARSLMSSSNRLNVSFSVQCFMLLLFSLI